MLWRCHEPGTGSEASALHPNRTPVSRLGNRWKVETVSDQRMSHAQGMTGQAEIPFRPRGVWISQVGADGDAGGFLKQRSPLSSGVVVIPFDQQSWIQTFKGRENRVRSYDGGGGDLGL